MYSDKIFLTFSVIFPLFAMTLTIQQRRKLRTTGLLIIGGIVLGPVFTVFSDGFTAIFPYINAVIIGFSVALLVALLELYVFTKRIRKLTFLTILLLRTGLYMVCITIITFLILVFARTIRYNMSFSAVLKSEEFQRFMYEGHFIIIIVYILAIAFTVNFTRQMSRKMGQGVLLSFITGKYYRPIQQERIFMFMHIMHSDHIMQKLGHTQSYQFLNDFIYDVTEPILVHRGVIYQYVDDEIVVSWDMKHGLKNAHCIRTFFAAKRAIYENREHYYNQYGLVPQLQAGFHCGPVIIGEIGDIKSEIAFYGDIMNTTSRIVAQCTSLNKTLLISVHLMSKLTLPAIYESEACGHIQLKGKEKPMELHTVEEAKVQYI